MMYKLIRIKLVTEMGTPGFISVYVSDHQGLKSNRKDKLRIRSMNKAFFSDFITNK